MMPSFSQPDTLPSTGRRSGGKTHKITCQSCGLVNLDRFVSYPFCAACGTRLPENQSLPWLGIWKKRVPTLGWALPVGAGIAALSTLAVGIVFETRPRPFDTLAVVTQIPTQGKVGDVLEFQFALDTVVENQGNNFSDVKLRLSREINRNFVLVELAPAPTSRQTLGSGLYCFWTELPAGSTLRLRLRPRSAGDFEAKFGVSATDYEGFEVHRQLHILKEKHGR